MRWIIVLVLCAFLQVGFASSAQKINLTKTNASIKDVFKEIKKQTGYTFVYLTDVLDHASPISIELKDATIEEAVSKCLESQGLEFTIKNKTIVLNLPAKQGIQTLNTSTIQQKDRVVGMVVDADGLPVPNATVQVKGTKLATRTDDQGRFVLSTSTSADLKLQVTCVGFAPQEVTYKTTDNNITVKLVSSSQEIEDAVVTGIYTRSREDFTGSAATFTAEQLKMVGSQNILLSLRTLDPSFAITDNNEFGSDPNTLPDMDIRGKTSIIGLSQEYENDPNQPLFILDGYETSLRTIYDLNIDRVESITILKDASATAIYGSKAANGVIVVETKQPEAGKFRINYNLNTTFSFADLSDYNLMNAAEKLEFELLSGLYGPTDQNGKLILEQPQGLRREALYYQRLAEIQRGVDSYFMNEPLRTGLTQGHNIRMDGGDQVMRYGIGFSYNNVEGVMKGSSRNTYNGNLTLNYRAKKFTFNNNLTLNYGDGLREPVPFSAYSEANPFFRKYNEFGSIKRSLDIDTTGLVDVHTYNPMYNATLNYLDKSPTFGFSNNLDVEWRAHSAIRVRGRFSLNKSENISERFTGPSHTMYDRTQASDKGAYSMSKTDAFRYNTDLTATYGKLLNNLHMVNFVTGLRMDHKSDVMHGFNVRGFMEDAYPNPAFANGYIQGSKPQYKQTEARSASYYLNTSYTYDRRYLMDASLRQDGSSLFGVKNKFTFSWAAGLSWNIHNEKFMKDLPWISYFKIRGSIGMPGNQNFDARMTMNIYEYTQENQNPFSLAARVRTWGNQDLDWQQTLDKNLGIDIELLNRKFRLNVDFVDKLTDPLLVFVDVPTSTGSTTVPKNIGAQATKGYTVTLNWQAIRMANNLGLALNANVRRLKNTYSGFGSALDRFNIENQSKSLQRFMDGGSPSDMYAVRSAGIDPATGREVFIKRDGTQTFVHDYADEVLVGTSTPKAEGVVGSTFNYKGFSVQMNFRYTFGKQVQLSSLFNKVENISSDGLRVNHDRRALYDRWQKPGDITKFKGISLTEQTQMTDRFIADENTFSAESISFSYRMLGNRLAAYGISSLTMRASTNQIFRISTVSEERGIRYPFARSFNFGLGIGF